MAKIISTNTYVIYINDSNSRHQYSPQKIKYVKKNIVKKNTVKNKSETTSIHKCIAKRSWYVRYRSGRKTWKRSQYFKYKKDANEYYRTIVNDAIKPKREEPKSHFKKTERITIPNSDRERVAHNQSHKCNMCEEPLRPPSKVLDHIIPLKFGGANHISNYQYLCCNCHGFKTNYFDNKIIKPLLLKNKRLKPEYFVSRQKKEYKKYFS